MRPIPAAPRPSFLAEFWDAVSPRTAAMVAGVLAIQLLFIASYVGAFHKPTPHAVPIGVVAPPSIVHRTIAKLDAAAGHPVQAQTYQSRDAAAAAIRSDRIAGAIVIDPASSTDTLLVASGGGSALASAIEEFAIRTEAVNRRTVRVEDLVPLQPGDYRGLSGFYLVVGWIVGGYLVASMLGVSSGARPATTRRAVIRLLSLIPYAILSGLGGALIVDQGLGALTGHFLALAALGMLLVYAAVATTTAFQVLFGVIGIGITVLVFVVAGNPSAGGAYQPALLPGVFRAVGSLIPNGAGVDTVRRIVYFGGQGITVHLLTICVWIVAGVAVALLGSLRIDRRRPTEPVPAA